MFENMNFLHRKNPFRRYIIMILISLIQPVTFNHLYANANTGKPLIVAEDTIKRTVSSPQSSVLQVYLDCRRCDFDFIRTELNFVNYVRDPELANLHVFVTDVTTGGGGREYQFTFIGRGPFEGTSYTLKHYTDRNATQIENMEALKEFLKMGFAAYLFQTPMGNRFSIEYRGDRENLVLEKTEDPWDYWVFQAYVGQVRLDLQSNMSVFNARWGFFADRVTEQWKLRFRPYFNYGSVKIQTGNGKDPLYSKQHRHGLDSHIIKSLTRHWSAGLFADYQTNKGRNLRHQAILSSGIEFSLFPYEEATRKSITLTYLVGSGFHDYYEETIFGQNKEILFSQRLRGLVNIRQPWGNLETGLTASNYFHDYSRRRIEFYGRTSVRVFEGFSLSFQAEYQVVRDQLSLPKGSASIEDVLLKQRELATDFSLAGSVAVSYTFGSRFANVVNTRF
jgi:hypothetical protein